MTNLAALEATAHNLNAAAQRHYDRWLELDNSGRANTSYANDLLAKVNNIVAQAKAAKERYEAAAWAVSLFNVDHVTARVEDAMAKAGVSADFRIVSFRDRSNGHADEDGYRIECDDDAIRARIVRYLASILSPFCAERRTYRTQYGVHGVNEAAGELRYAYWPIGD